MYYVEWTTELGSTINRIMLDLDEAYGLIKQLKKNPSKSVRAFAINAKEISHIDLEINAEFLDGCDQCDDRDA